MAAVTMNSVIKHAVDVLNENGQVIFNLIYLDLDFNLKI